MTERDSLNVLDVCAGIGSFSEAAHRAGLTSVCQIEIEPLRRAVLAKHFPDVQRLHDLTKVDKHDITEPIDIICGGTPCQDLSIAGHGKGLAGTRSRLWYDFLRLAHDLRPQWLVWENVPNALSSNGGRDFRTILMGLDECGYHVAWRILDAQYCGVPQRRRRIFLVGHLRDGRAAQVLFERESLPGNSGTRPAAWKANARAVDADTEAPSDRGDTRRLSAEAYDARNHRLNGDISGTLQAKSTGGYSLNYQNPIVIKIDNTKANGRGVLEDGTTHSLGGATDAVQITEPAHSFRMRGFGDYVEDDIAAALKKRDGKDATDLVTVWTPSRYLRPEQDGIAPQTTDTMATLTKALAKSADSSPHIEYRSAVRRLTPLECTRLQGFPDDWLDGLGLSDTKKYEMLGDSIALPCSEWIMRRIAALSTEG
jgi:DNA (cytosine-5)-methyltransferase 1